MEVTLSESEISGNSYLFYTLTGRTDLRGNVVAFASYVLDDEETLHDLLELVQKLNDDIHMYDFKAEPDSICAQECAVRVQSLLDRMQTIYGAIVY